MAFLRDTWAVNSDLMIITEVLAVIMYEIGCYLGIIESEPPRIDSSMEEIGKH